MVWLVIGGSIPVATFSKHNGLQAISGFMIVSLLLISKVMNIFYRPKGMLLQRSALGWLNCMGETHNKT